MKPQPTIDFELLDQDATQAAALSRRTLLWLGGLLAVVAVSIVLLASFLRTVEMQEETRRRAADAEWLDQLLRFHFHRLESDLADLARQVQRRQAGPVPAPARGGMVWRSPGLVLSHGWIDAAALPAVDRWPAFLQTPARQPDQAGALAAMLDTTRGLRRAAYAGPLPQPDGAPPGRLLWLAVPLFDQDRFLGAYVAAVELDQTLRQLVPAWFLRDHAVAIVDLATEARASTDDMPDRFVASVNLPGAQWKLVVDVLDSEPALAPRAFFGIALLCLGAMLVALFLLWRDTSRRRHAESQLQLQQVLRAAMERSVTLGLRAWDPAGRLLYVNQAFCRMVGWSAKELIEHPGPAPYWPAHQGAEGQVSRQAPAQALGQELQLRHRDGSLLDVLVHGGPLTSASGAVIGWIESALDITERKRIERLAARQHEKLEASGRLIAVGEVASTLAHELNQPLGALSSFASGLLNRVREQRITLDEIAPVVERMERIADKAGRVIQRVNAFARRQEMTRQPLAVCDFLRRVVGQVPLPDGLVLQLQLPEDELTLPADALLLEHAVHNVVLNATEWAGQGARAPAQVRVGLTRSEGRVGIEVEDSGPGVPPEQLGSIFDAFASQKLGGMGMGLSICRSIVEAHHGHIEVGRSPALDGAKFTLWLPLNP